MDWKLILTCLLGLLAFGWSFIFKLFWSELKALRGDVKDALLEIGLNRIETAKLSERLDGQKAEIRDLKKHKR